MKSEQLVKFENPVFGEITGYIDEKGEPWFLAGNVCRCLGIKNSSDAINNIIQEHNDHQDHIKGVDIIYTLLQTEGGRQKVCCIKENILYELVFKSKKEKAFDFRQWVFREVLTALRKHGEYRMNGKLIRRSLTDAIKEEIVDKSDSPNAKFAYSNFSKLVNKSLGLEPKSDRSGLSDDMLEKIARRENLVQALISEGKTYGEIKCMLLDKIAK
jgi:prophage antirepressor-like protein